MGAASPEVGLGVSATRGVMWTGLAQVLKQAVQIVTSIVLARLLVPADFGVLGMALVFVGVAQLFANFGIGAALVQSQSPARVALSSSFWANLALALVVALAIAAAAPLIARFYANPAVGPVVATLSITLLLSGAIVVPQAILYRQLRFGAIAKAQIAGALAGAALALLLAVAGAGVWSLVAQPLFGSTVTVVMMVVFARWLPAREFSWPSIRSLVRFSAGVLGSDLLNYVNRNADNLLIGRFIGSGPLGFYSMAYQIMLYPLQQVSSVIVRVLFPTLSLLQSDLPRFRRAYLKSVETIAIVTFPMMMGLFAVAEDFVRVVLGEKWLGMLDVLRILAWVGLVQSVSTTVGTIYLSTGRVRTMFNIVLVATPLIVIAMAAGLVGGIAGVAAGYAVANAVVFYISMYYALRLVDLSLTDFHRAVWRPFVSALVMLGVVMLCGSALATWTPAVRLALLVAIGVLVYALTAFAINRRHVLEVVALSAAAFRREA